MNECKNDLIGLFDKSSELINKMKYIRRISEEIFKLIYEKLNDLSVITLLLTPERIYYKKYLFGKHGDLFLDKL